MDSTGEKEVVFWIWPSEWPAVASLTHAIESNMAIFLHLDFKLRRGTIYEKQNQGPHDNLRFSNYLEKLRSGFPSPPRIQVG